MAHPSPVGTLKEIREMHLDESKVGCCAQRIKEGKKVLLIGCDEFPTCPLSCREERGPLRYGYETIKPAQPNREALVRQDWGMCFQVLKIQRQQEDAGNIFRIIAVEEGYECGLPHAVTRVGTRPLDPQGAKFRRKDDSLPYEAFMEEETIPTFPRPKDNPALRKETLAARRAKEVSEQAKQKRLEDAFGIEVKGDPIDIPKGKSGRSKASD